MTEDGRRKTEDGGRTRDGRNDGRLTMDEGRWGKEDEGLRTDDR